MCESVPGSKRIELADEERIGSRQLYKHIPCSTSIFFITIAVL